MTKLTAVKAPSSLLLAGIAMASPLALNAFIPAMPDVAQSLEQNISTIQLTFTLYLLTLAIGQLICGPLSDYFGRRPVLIVGLALHVLGSLLGATAQDIDQLIGGRILQALGGSAGMVLVRTILLDIHGREGAANKMGYVVMAIAIAQAIAPTVGGYINLWFDWHSIFYLSLLISTLIWILTILRLPETGTEKTTSLGIIPILNQYSDILRSPAYLGYTLSTTFIACAFYLFVGSMPYIVVKQLGGTSADFGNWFLSVSLAFMAGSFLSTRISARLKIDNMIRAGNGLSLFGAALLLMFTLTDQLHYVTLFLPMAMLTFGRGMSQPSAQLAAISCSSGKAGTASGLMGFIQLITGAAVAQSIPFLMHTSVVLLSAFIFLAPLLSWVSHHYAINHSK
ncbi:multidrug effflux MFS transporter [Pontibacterium sp.]|uniref:multidrug effflux MFS transporter n=1 Tax=Pontibacterium sp. TaxID=2036026 RepID=UPI00356635E3